MYCAGRERRLSLGVAAAMLPLVSIVIPTYNRSAFLRRAVESVVAQSYQNWELIVADDGSTDDTAGWVSGLADPRIRILPLDHSGNPGRVRNQALKDARGRFVAFLDSDDWWEQEKLSLQVAALLAHPACGWSYTSLRRVDEAGRDIAMADSSWIPEEGFVLDRLVSGNAIVITSTVMVDRTLLESLNGFDEAFPVAEDFDLWIRLAERSPAAGVAQVLVARRRHAGNYSALGEDFETMESVYARLIARFPAGRIRQLHRQRRARWLAKVADERRRAGAYGGALSALRRGFPEGATMPAWWRALLKTLAGAALAPGRRRT